MDLMAQPRVSMATGLFCLGLFLLQIKPMSALLSHSARTEPLHHFLSDVTVVRPIRTDSEGRALPGPAPWPHLQEVFYNLTLQGEELHLCLRISSRLTAPGATLLWEESGVSEPITEQHCLYSGHASNDPRVSAAVNVCHGLEGVILTPAGDFYIEPLLNGSDPLRSRFGPGAEPERDHVIYRPTNHSRAQQKPANQSTEQEAPPTDVLRGPVFGPEVLGLRGSWFSLGSGSGPGSGWDWVQTLKRRRRSTEAELFHIEVLLAVDYSVLLFHGRENIQRYLLTFMHVVNEIYQEPSLGANINIVLVQIVLLSPTKSQQLVAVGNAQKSLENVCTWSFLHQREQRAELQHDHTIYLSRQEFGPAGMQGYAPVTGMCQLIRSCVLVIDDGFSSAFVAAHETGHVLGMEHDGEVNDCEDDVLLGSIMSPQVQASFYRYHWSRCSWRELHRYLHTYECLRDDPFLQSWPVQPQLPGFSFSMDQQCQYDWGHGFTTCTAYTVLDPCKQLWCSHYNNPFYCKTKKGPPLDGTRCGPGQHCFRGNCVRITPDLLRTHGAWGKWSAFGSCSRSCGSGVQFRTRRCDSPSPANGGRTCFGNSYEFGLCNRDQPCPALTDFRAEQCKVWNPFFEHNGTKHHWLPLQHPDPDERCRLHCFSTETGAAVHMGRNVHDGTLCSYEDQHSVCVRGECEHVGCDGQIASDKSEDRCGVCGGDNSSCKVIKGNFTRSARKNGLLKILEIPKGARHLLVQEFKSTPHVLAVKNSESGLLFLNDEHHFPESRAVVEGGVLWQYVNGEEVESVQTAGPLSYSVLLMVRSHGVGKVTVSYKYVLQEALRSGLDSNLLLEDAMFYEWALKRWSSCSKPCGGGKQYTRFGCRRKADGKMVHRMFCSNINKPRAIHRDCNREDCATPEWSVGPWQACSASCGQSGWSRRWVSCQQESRGGQQRSVPSKLCSGDKPESKSSCNRTPCPAAWRSAPWSPCSVSCGAGTQERQVKCLTPDGSPGNCSAPQPITMQSCLAPPCSGGEQRNSIVRWLSRSSPESSLSPGSGQRCRGDRSVFCQMEVLSRYCSLPGYRVMCCVSCAGHTHNATLSTAARGHAHNAMLSTVARGHAHNATLSTAARSLAHNATLSTAARSHAHNGTLSTAARSHAHNTTLSTAARSHAHNATLSTVARSHAHNATPPATHNSSRTTMPHRNTKAFSKQSTLKQTALSPASVPAPRRPQPRVRSRAEPAESRPRYTTPPPDDIATEAPPPDDITTEAPPPDDITTEAPPPDDITTEAPPPDDITTEAPLPDDITTEAPLPDDITTVAPPPDDITTEALLPDDITTEAPPPDDFVYVDYGDDYDDYSSYETDPSEIFATTTVSTTTATTMTTTKRPRKPPRPETRRSSAPSEVRYAVVAVAEGGDVTAPRGQFVPRKTPRFSERTQNKRIEELLREKRLRTGL